LTVVSSRIDVSDVSARLLFPTVEQGPWAPFERFAETLATSRKKVGTHSHQGEEVLAFVIEGSVDHADRAGHHLELVRGSVLLFTAATEASHELRMQKGRTARWISVVVRLPAGVAQPKAAVQVSTPERREPAPDGTVETRLVGPNETIRGYSGLEGRDIEFVEAGTCICRIGRDRQGIVYVLGGSGTVDNVDIDPGDGALLEKASGVALHGSSGYRVILVSAPRWSG
jgi:redox-sensitive bicupin YhaK (pirin superfamily)